MSAATETRRNLPASEDEKAVSLPSPEEVIKHPLNSKWCLWYFINEKNMKWEDCLVQVASYDTVEDFWALYNHIESASRLKMGCDYSLFKDGIKPMWEDEANINGGRWSIGVPKQQRQQDLDNMWLEMIMMMVGENEDPVVNEDICGAVVSVRPRGDRLALWISSKQADISLKVGRSLKKALNIPHDHQIEFNLHSDTSNKRSSTVRALYTV